MEQSLKHLGNHPLEFLFVDMILGHYVDVPEDIYVIPFIYIFVQHKYMYFNKLQTVRWSWNDTQYTRDDDNIHVYVNWLILNTQCMASTLI